MAQVTWGKFFSEAVFKIVIKDTFAIYMGTFDTTYFFKDLFIFPIIKNVFSKKSMVPTTCNEFNFSHFFSRDKGSLNSAQFPRKN